MDRFFRRRASMGAALALLATRAWAQDTNVPANEPRAPDAPPAAAAPAAPALVPPELLESSEADYPAEARAEGLEGTVVLLLTIAADGSVTDADVVEPVGHGFDEAARSAALRFRFRPALRNGEPITARIRYPYAFKLAVEPAPLPAAAGAGVAAIVPPEAAPAAAAEPAPIDAAVAAEPAGPVSVQVLGSENEGQRLQRSAAAVNVIDTRRAKQQSADLGEVLARSQGVAVRREGGLGSDARFSLNGLYDDQIRFFLDGVPLERAGYPFGIANVPVNLVDRVEVYRGVVPIRLGADALGGAVNLVSDQSYESHLGASYQVGSFGTARFTLDGRYRDLPTGLVAGVAGFLDRARNDYEVDVEVPDARGRLFPATVPRFHDGYIAYGGTVEAGVVERPWARRLLLSVFGSTYDKELQNNIVMTVPYGEAHYGETVYGGTLRYEVAPSPVTAVELVANYAHRTIDFVDKSSWVYDWFGQRIRERRVGGEIESDPTDQVAWENSFFARARGKWTLSPGQSLELSSSPSYTTRTGDERIQANPAARDPLTAKRALLTLVSGIEHQLDLLDERLQNVVFVKDYVYAADSEEVLPGNIFRERDEDKHSLGFGDSLRFRFTPWLYAKASYEYATRLPRPDEVFGDGVLILANLELEPEVSHNANIGPRLELVRTPIGDVTLDINAFLRESDELIVLLGNDRFFTYQNVYEARSLGLENALGWTSPGHYLSLDGTVTWQDVRNASDQGTFGDFEGDRIPNRPYLFASWGARAHLPGVPGADDALEPFYNARYVHAFFRGWESQGLREFKQVVDAQVTHSVGVSWIFNSNIVRTSTTFEIDNLTDAKAYDFFGVQRPGRAINLKLTGEI
jgi:TonB family protein